MDNSVEEKLIPEEIIFALDIGTRSVLGIVGYQDNDTFNILDVEIIYHSERTMYDGQIHDIDGVVQVVKQIKKSMEEKLGFPLKEVAIAAAGRALKTYQVQVDRLIDNDREIDRSLVNNLEMEGIQIAQTMLENDGEKKNAKYYCVGYTVINYYLNDTVIGSLLGHKGNKIAANILATFLPHIVVDSLYTVMNRVGLEVMSMSLEPIAAINVSIPPKARLLNLALVDIGAGTSDIAITKGGAIVAYAMASVAGDEITEEMAQKYLLDFDSAENLKLNLKNSEIQTFTDIVGIEYELKTQEILDQISPAIQNLANQIGENILRYNEKAPSAIFLIGGGSQIPRLTDYLAEKLSMPKERIVIRGTEIIQNVRFNDDRLRGPESITPIGIAVTAVKNLQQDFLHVTVDNKKIKMFNAKQLSISDALILIGYNPKKLIAQKGPSLNLLINGTSKTINGEYGENGNIFLNGRLANLETKLNNEDDIIIEPATEGKEASAKVGELLPKAEIILFNETEIELLSDIRLNGEQANLDDSIREGDSLSYKQIKNLKDLVEFLELDYADYELYINNQLATLDCQLKNQDRVVSKERDLAISSSSPPPLEKELANTKNLQTVTITFNDQPLTFEHDRKTLMLVDVFNYVEFDITKVQGQIEIELNGNKASFMDPLKSGDTIRIYWD